MVKQPQEHCSGCSVCSVICPKGAILMQEQNGGFIYPSVNYSTCINCNLCNKICPENALPDFHLPKAVFAAITKDKTELSSCASGGIATTFGKIVLKRGGVVYGCSQKNYRSIKHIRVAHEDELQLLKGSKYVQSDLLDVYAEIKRDITTGRPILFIGTPCQIQALKSYLQKPYLNLYTVDLVCHGVPSLAMLKDSIEKKGFTDNDISVNFRWKTDSSVQFGMQLIRNNQILMTEPASRNAYMTAFLAGLSFRENCHYCRYSCVSRVGDITIGDFWGLEKTSSTQLNHVVGVSLVLVNNEHKGEELWNLSKTLLFYEPHTIEEAIKGNWNLHDPSPRPENKDVFLETFSRQGIKQAAKRCVPRFRRDTSDTWQFINRAVKLVTRVIKHF